MGRMLVCTVNASSLSTTIKVLEIGGQQENKPVESLGELRVFTVPFLPSYWDGVNLNEFREIDRNSIFR